jgi:hypothetical protein
MLGDDGHGDMLGEAQVLELKTMSGAFTVPPAPAAMPDGTAGFGCRLSLWTRAGPFVADDPCAAADVAIPAIAMMTKSVAYGMCRRALCTIASSFSWQSNCLCDDPAAFSNRPVPVPFKIRRHGFVVAHVACDWNPAATIT